MSGNPPNPVGRTESGISESFAEQLRKVAEARGRERRGRAIDDLAASVQTANAAVPVLMRLAGSDRHGQRLAFEIAQRLPAPLSEPICRLLQPLLASERFKVPLRLNVALQILRSIPSEAPLVSDVLQALTHEMTPLRAAERLHFLRQRLPGHIAVERRYFDLEKQAALTCPRCGLRLKRAELVMHLWQVHRLLMEGNRARDPWKMIEDWLREYTQTRRADLLERSLELGQQLDPENGLTHVHRLVRAAGLTDEEADQNLTTQAMGRRASLCPYCYALVQQKHAALPLPISSSRGRISGDGYSVEVSDRYIFTRLFVSTPEVVLHEGTEPDHELTHRGSVILQIGPMVLFALLLAIFLPLRLMLPLTPTALILLAALILYMRLRRHDGLASDPTQRAIDHAWEFIVPELHRPHFSRPDAEFLGSLAMASIGFGSPEHREKPLDRMCRLTREKLGQHGVPSGDLAALRSLEMDDAMRLGRDPAPILANELAACFAAELPLQYAEQLLDAWPVEALDRGQRARLRILLCASAFGSGLEARDLHELGRVSESLGQSYASEDLDGLARLRWVWNGKPDRVWKANGAATTVFDLARYPVLGAQFLEERPDLLLFQPMSVGTGRDAAAPILICEEGVVYRDILINDPETPIVLKAKPAAAGGGFELAIGKQKLVFKQEPALLARRLKGWLRYLFVELLPGASGLASKRSPEQLRPLLDQKTIHCPECGNSFLALRGEVGILTDAKVVS